jgi:hypothetical protein
VGDHRRRRAVRIAVAASVSFAVTTTGVGTAFALAREARDEPVAVDEAPRTAHVPVDAALVSRARLENERALRAAQLAHDLQVAQYLAAVAEYYRPKTGVDWDGIAQCETGGNWSMQGSRFSGGLGFYNGTWSSFGGREFAANAGQATREEQIVVAERVYARHGLSGWGCREYG